MEPNNFEILTMTDKEKRDAMYEDLRKNGDEHERQAVKFSSSEPVMEGSAQKVVNGKPVWRTTWSVAYPSGRG